MKLPPLKIRDGDVIQLPPGVCEVEGTEIVLNDVYDVVIQGHSNTTLVTKSTVPVIQINGGSNIALRGFSIQGPGPLHSPNNVYSAFISLSGPYDGLSFEDLTLQDMPNHGIGDLNTRFGRNVLFNRCQAYNGGNYGNVTGLKWDGAAFAVGVENVTYRDCTVKNCIRGFEMENPRSDCTFLLDGCHVSDCSHVAAWVTPTGGQNGITSQRFSGKIVNCTFENGIVVPGGFNPSGIVCTGGTDVVIANNIVRGFPNGSGIQCRADHAAISRFVIGANIVTNCQVGIVFAKGIEGACAAADCGVITGNIVAGAQVGYDYITTGATNVQVK